MSSIFSTELKSLSEALKILQTLYQRFKESYVWIYLLQAKEKEKCNDSLHYFVNHISILSYKIIRKAVANKTCYSLRNYNAGLSCQCTTHLSDNICFIKSVKYDHWYVTTCILCIYFENKGPDHSGSLCYTKYELCKNILKISFSWLFFTSFHFI